MSLLTHNELVDLVESGAIEGVHPDNINGASIDLNLADGFWTEAATEPVEVYLGRKEKPRMTFHRGRLALLPGDPRCRRVKPG